MRCSLSNCCSLINLDLIIYSQSPEDSCPFFGEFELKYSFFVLIDIPHLHYCYVNY